MFLGIDLGTSAIKACILDHGGKIVGTSTVPLEVSQPMKGASEQNCEEWWQACCKAVNGLQSELRGNILGIGFSGQMHGAVVLDREYKPVRPVMLWNDARSSAQCAALETKFKNLGEITGVPTMAGFTAPKLMWIKEHEPELFTKIKHILLPKDYLGLRMHGQLVTDPSDAAGTSLFDQKKRQWSDEICRACGIDIQCLPRVLSGNEAVGPLLSVPAKELGLKEGIPIVAGAGDAAAGAIGIGAIADGDGFISLGTSGQLFLTVDAYKSGYKNCIHSYAHTLPDKWFYMAAMLNGARPIAWLSELLKRPIDELMREAEAAEAGPLFLPYLTGERTPHGDSDIRAGFALLDETTTHGNLMYSVVEAIAFSFADAIEALSKTRVPPKNLLVIGGGTRSDFLLQKIADAIGCTLHISKEANVGPALGAARLAASGVQANTIMSFEKPSIVKVFRPSEQENQRMAKRFLAYRELYSALRSVQKKLMHEEDLPNPSA